MEKKIGKSKDFKIALLFIILPTVMLIFGYLFFPYLYLDITKNLILIPLFLGLVILFTGFLYKKIGLSNKLKILGWLIFAFYWSTQTLHLYYSEGEDYFNAIMCIIGVFVLCYLAYHEWLSLNRKEKNDSLNWIAGASAIAGIIYFTVEKSYLAEWLIETVAAQSAWTHNFLIGDTVLKNNIEIYYKDIYTVTIIFACTAIQAMVVFVGMISVIPKVEFKRKILGLIITLIPIYILNLLRNAMVVFLVGNDITDFFMAHNVISKIGALITLIVLLLFLIKIIPEILDEIIKLSDLYKRNGPLEKFVKKYIWKSK